MTKSCRKGIFILEHISLPDASLERVFMTVDMTLRINRHSIDPANPKRFTINFLSMILISPKNEYTRYSVDPKCTRAALHVYSYKAL